MNFSSRIPPFEEIHCLLSRSWVSIDWEVLDDTGLPEADYHGKVCDEYLYILLPIAPAKQTAIPAEGYMFALAFISETYIRVLS